MWFCSFFIRFDRIIEGFGLVFFKGGLFSDGVEGLVCGCRSCRVGY